MQIMIDAMTLEGKWFGPEPSVAPTIVMLHKGLGSVSTWRDFPEQLTEATGAGVFAYTRSGHVRLYEIRAWPFLSGHIAPTSRCSAS